MGSALSQRWGFRSIFATLAALAGLFLVQTIMFLPETLQSVAENGSVRLHGIKYNVMSRKQSDLVERSEMVIQKLKLWDFWEPLSTLGEMDALLDLLFGAVVYAMWSMITGTTTMLFTERFDPT